VTTTSSTSSTSSSSSTSWSTDVSNYDWSALIEAQVDDVLATEDTIETKISDNESKISAYEELQDLLSDFADAVETLSNPESSTAEDAFDARTATITSSDSSVSADSVVSLTLESGAAIGSYDLQVKQIATANKVAGSIASSETTALSYDGEFTIGLEDGDTATITVDSDMTLADIADAINNATDTTNVQATIVKISDTEYELVLSATNTGYDINVSATSGDDILTELGVTDDAGEFTDVLQEAQNSIIVLDGIEITRDSNEIDDVLDGVTINLYQKSDDATLTLDIETDTDTIETYIEDLVTAYNSIRDFVLTQQETSSDGTASDDAVLFGDSTLRSIVNSIYNALTTTVGGLSMSDLGLSFDDSNYLELDTSVLESELASDLDGVKSLLTAQVTTSSSQLGVVARGTEAPSSFTLDIELADDGSISSVSVDGDSSLFTVSGTTIKGVTGTAYEGYTFAYTGSKSASVDVTVSYGMCAKLYDVADAAADSDTGSLETLIESLSDKNEDLEDDIDAIETKASDLEDRLTTRYSKIAAAVAEAQSTLDYLDALLNSD
jgi:flagellar hook-associated protein 2